MKRAISPELTKEEMAEEIKKGKDKMQEDFINKILEDVKWLQEKAIKTSYHCTVNEKLAFEEVYKIINGMAKWF